MAGFEQTYSAFSGSVADAVVPLNVLEQVGEDGDCTLLRRNNPFCDPGCAAGETCDFDGNCLPFPVNRDVGVTLVAGRHRVHRFLEHGAPIGVEHPGPNLPNPVSVAVIRPSDHNIAAHVCGNGGVGLLARADRISCSVAKALERLGVTNGRQGIQVEVKLERVIVMRR